MKSRILSVFPRSDAIFPSASAQNPQRRNSWPSAIGPRNLDFKEGKKESRKEGKKENEKAEKKRKKKRDQFETVPCDGGRFDSELPFPRDCIGTRSHLHRPLRHSIGLFRR